MSIGTNIQEPKQHNKVANIIPCSPKLQFTARSIDNGILTIAPITEQIVWILILPNPLVTFTYIAPNCVIIVYIANIAIKLDS